MPLSPQTPEEFRESLTDTPPDILNEEEVEAQNLDPKEPESEPMGD